MSECPIERGKMDSEKLITVKEMAERLRVPKKWIYERTRLGQWAIPHFRIGKHIRFDPVEVLAFFHEHGDVSAL